MKRAKDSFMNADDLFAQLKHPNPNLRDRAMVQIAETSDETTVPRLLALMDEDDVAYRRAAVKTLGVIGPEAIPAITDALKTSDDPTARASCTKAMAQVAVNYPDDPFPESGIAGLKLALADTNPVVHIAAIMTLGAIGAPVLDILIDELRTSDNPAKGVAIANALGSIGEQQAIEVLTEVANDESVDSYVRESATSAISRAEMIANYRKASPQ
ncbi:MAG: HEAT repeat domain-containing protein [Cyanobacteria bacterium P01_D01_bin.123]